MDDVPYHQTQADHFLALADSHARAGNFVRSVDALERAVSHAAAAANSHWHIFERPTRRKLGRVLYMMAGNGHLSYTSAKSIHRFDDLYTSLDRACLAGNRPAARRTFRNSHRRVARIIHSVNQAIAADPHPSVAIPEPVEHWTINDG